MNNSTAWRSETRFAILAAVSGGFGHGEQIIGTAARISANWGVLGRSKA